MSPVIVPPPYFRAPIRRVVYIEKNLIREKKFISPSPPFYVLRYTGSASSVLLCFIVSLLTYQARSIAQLLSPATLLSLPLRDALLKLVRFPSLLLVALQPSLIVLLQVPLKNSPDFQYKIGDFRWYLQLIQQYNIVSTVVVVIVQVFLIGSYQYSAVFIIVGRYLSVAVQCQRGFHKHIGTGSCQIRVAVRCQRRFRRYIGTGSYQIRVVV